MLHLKNSVTTEQQLPSTATALLDKQLLLKDINSHCPSRQQLLLKDNNDWTTVRTTTTAHTASEHHLIVFWVSDVMITEHHHTASGHCLIAIILFVVSALHTTTTQHAATYISNGPKCCHNYISSGIASSKSGSIQRPRTHSFLGVLAWHHNAHFPPHILLHRLIVLIINLF